MDHILDNPIWQALCTRNSAFSLGGDQAKYFRRDIAAFAGMKQNSQSDFENLYDLATFDGPVILFTPGEILIPQGWKHLVSRSVLQMVYTQRHVPAAGNHKLVCLAEKDIPSMLELTALTNPGPFFPRTMDFGNYRGIFDGDRLVAMAGQRLQLTGYTEISAVCTRPDYAGRGYAAALLKDQIQIIKAASCIPFLHVYPDNISACKLYEKLGFHTRRKMWVYMLEKQTL